MKLASSTCRRLLYAISGSLALIMVVLAITLDPSKIGRGLLLREHFYRYRPTSYWRAILHEQGNNGRISPEVADDFQWSSRALRVLRELVVDDDPAVRWAALVLFQTCAFPGESERILRRALDDADPNIRCAACRGLGRLKRDALSSLPKLVHASRDSDAAVAWAADYAVWSIDPKYASQQPPWHKFCCDKWQFVAMLPGTPNEKIITVETPVGASQISMFQCMHLSSTISVAVNEYPQELPAGSQTFEFHAKACALKAEKMGGQLTQCDRIELRGLEGCDDCVKVANKGTLRTRVFSIGQRCYQISVASPENEPLHANAEDFILNSLDISFRPMNSDASN